jgi:hypothetical protein
MLAGLLPTFWKYKTVALVRSVRDYVSNWSVLLTRLLPSYTGWLYKDEELYNMLQLKMNAASRIKDFIIRHTFSHHGDS